MKVRSSRKLGDDRLKRLKATPVDLGDDRLVTSAPLRASGALPLLVEPTVEGLDLAVWLPDHYEWVDEKLLAHGGILFRGFGIDSVSRFNEILGSVSPSLMEYRERSAPRTQLEGRVYTSTEYPPHQRIAFHNEFSYALQWPLRIGFCCLVEPGEGGETPIADSRAVYRDLDPAVREPFERLGVMYERNYGAGLDLPWQEVFQTESRAEVEEYCRRAPMSFEWRDGGRLRTRAVRHALAIHPGTGETVWFNQAHLFHVSNLEPSVRGAMIESLGEENLPRTTLFGDGSPIPLEALEAVRAAYDRNEVAFPWRLGDFLLLDNMLVAHGRNAFEGERKIAVGMVQPHGIEATRPVATDVKPC